MMLRSEIEGVKFLEFELFAEFSKKLKHAIFLRHGGFSEGNFHSLNLSYQVGDVFETVKQNEEKMLSIFGVKNLIRANLCHGKDVVDIEKILHDNAYLADGIATNKKEIALLVTHADCQAACFYDPVEHAVANVHAGWRGLTLNIYSQAIHFMQKAYGSKAENLHVAISPSLGPNDAEFLNYKEELPKNFWDFQVKENYFDLWSIAKMQLKDSGILDNHIQIAPISTYSNPKDYYSYRLQNVTGRHATVAALI